MRFAIALVLATTTARAGELGVGASIGAGAQGAASYGAVELRLDAQWPGVRIGLGVRGVWDDGVFRRSDWSRAADAVTIVRDVELVHELDDGGHVALAAGRLAPAHVGLLADGYRATLDDRWRTGVRTALSSRDLELGLEIDDVLDPALIGGAMRWQLAPPWGLHVAVAVDPTTPHTPTAVQLGATRRYEVSGGRADVGAAVVAEPELGMSAVAFVDGTLVRDDVRWTVRADARAGTGTVGSMFGPLYRIERLAHGGEMSLWDRARGGDLDGGSLGASVGAARDRDGWVELGLRARPGLGTLVTVNAGAPMSRWLQAGVWAAASPRDAAGAAEVRVAWARRWFSAAQVARIYKLDAMEPFAVWSVTAWIGATSD